LINFVAWDDITEANGAQGNEAEVESIKKVPILPSTEKKRAPEDVPAMQTSRQLKTFSCPSRNLAAG